MAARQNLVKSHFTFLLHK